MTRAEFIRQTVRQNLDRARMSAEIPGWEEIKRGKVRHVYRVRTEAGTNFVVISTSDRVSVFDRVQDRAIPFKSVVLNAISQWAFGHTVDIVPNAFLGSPTPHIMIQRETVTVGVECVVRGHIWGGLASEYERGLRIKCGIPLKEGLRRYQKLDSPIFTPTTKADQGHDQDITMEQMALLMQQKFGRRGIPIDGPELASRIRDVSLQLYDRGNQLAGQAGLIMVDTKYEFGLDPEGHLYLIDEVHTPDSSRYVDHSEWEEKWPLIRDLMLTGEWENVSQLLKDRPELKIAEISKQLVRDVLLERGYDPDRGNGPGLRDIDIVETTVRYIELYERLTGQPFDFHIDHPRHLDLKAVVQAYSHLPKSEP